MSNARNPAVIVTPDIFGAGGDAYGRLRTSQPFTLLDTVHQYDTSPLYWDAITANGAAITFQPTLSGVLLSTTTANGSSVKFQTRNYLRYQPGKAQTIVATGLLGPKTNNVIRRVGYYDDHDGLFFEVTGTDIAVVRRTSTSGAPVDNRTTQAQWNVDKLDGTGPSGVTLNITKMQVFFIDFQWLSVGVVRWGFEIGGQRVICNIEFHANVLTVPYMATGSLPVRYELANVGAAAAPNTLLSVCSTVISDGGQEILATPFGISTGAIVRTLNSSTPIPLLSIRPALTFNGLVNRALMTLTDVQVIANAAIVFEVRLNSTLTGASFSQVDSNSVAEFDASATAITDGTRLFAGLVANTAGAGISESALGLGRQILSLNAAGTGGDVLTVTGMKASSNASGVSAVFNWIEQR